MTSFRHARLAIAVLALSSLGLGAAAQADPILGRVVGSLIGVVVGKALINGGTKTANCRLYDRDGAEVFLPCDARRPVGEVMTAQPPVTIAPSPPYDLAQRAGGDRYAPPQDDCDCRDGGGYAQPSYGQTGAVYDAYSQGGDALRYSDSDSAYSAAYGDTSVAAYSLQSAYGGGQSIYAYGASGYGAGGYGDYGYGQPAAGRDPNGFLTWPGKR